MPVSLAPAGDLVATRRRPGELIRQLAVSVFLTVFCFVQAPGLVAADTKLDLNTDPWAFLRRALSLWDPKGAAGQLQNQAYGYLFPMGPFFGVGHSLGLPAWVVQRLWWTLLLLLAYHGMRVLTQSMRIGTTGSQLLAALTYVLAPRITGGLGAISVELWPMAVAPWVMIPLVRARKGDERRSAARSATAFFCAGGVNAVASGAVLVLPCLYLALRLGSPRHRRLMASWLGFCLMAMLWWLVPLLLLGRFSPPFLGWIESASVTTTLASLPEALRGTTHWIAGISGSGGPQWPSAFEVLTSRAGVFGGMVLALLGCWGLVRHDMPHRRFLRLGLVLGLVLLTLGHTGPLAPPWAEAFRHLLDGPLAPMRNLHKFDLIARMCIALGLAHILASVRLSYPGVPWLRQLLPAVAALCAIAITVPAAVTGTVQPGAFDALPQWWRQAASYLGDHPDERTLLLPGANFFTGLWGATRDEPIQPLARAPWIVRDAVPLGSAGATRVLNEVEQLVEQGRGGEELAGLLGDLGVSRVLVRADLDWRAVGAPPPLVVRQALLATPGVEAGKTFGPLVGGSPRADIAIDDGIDQPVPTLQVFEVGTSKIRPQMVPVTEVDVASGGPEAAGRPVLSKWWVLAGQQNSVWALRGAGGAAAETLTDTLQRREANFAAVRDNYGPLLEADQTYPAPRPSHDWLPPEVTAPNDQSTRTTGGTEVTASSSLATPLFGQSIQPARGPLAATDGVGDTVWVSARPAVGTWLRVNWPQAHTLPSGMGIQFAPDLGADVAAVEVHTDTGWARTPVDPVGAGVAGERRQDVLAEVPLGETKFVEVRVVSVRGDQQRPAAIAEIGVGAFSRVQASVRIPAPRMRVSAMSFSVRHDALGPCVEDGDGIARCQQRRSRQGEEDATMRRTIPGVGGSWTAVGTVVAKAGPALDRLLDSWHAQQATSEDSWLADPLVRPGSAVDGDPRTYWAGSGQSPSLSVSLPTALTVSSLRIDTDPRISGARPQRVKLTLGDAQLETDVEPDGSIAVPPTATRTIELQFVRSTTNTSVRTGAPRVAMPIVVGEVEVNGKAWPQAQAGASTGRACGFGPEITVGGRTVPTEVRGTLADIAAGRPVGFAACEPVVLHGAGSSVLGVSASGEFRPQTLDLMPVGQHAAAAPAVTLDWRANGPTARTVELPRRASAQVLSVPENANAGWRATLNGHKLHPVILNGWSQGWVVPAGAAGILKLRFEPQKWFMAGLGAGLVAALCLVIAAVWPRKRARHERVVDELASGRGAGMVTILTTFGCVVLLGGWWGLAALVIVAAVRRLTPLSEEVFLTVGVALALVCAWAPWPMPAASNHSGPAQFLGLLLVALVVTTGSTRHDSRSWGGPDPAPPG
jgi:arabinofuranan 3-O-arabinosyltransferase